MVGASLEEIEEEEEGEEEGVVAPPKEGCFQVIGTVKDKTSPKPPFVKEILNVCIKHRHEFLLFVVLF